MDNVSGGGQVRGHRFTVPVWLELLSACLTGALGMVTLVAHNWIEVVFKSDPDHGSGALEWVIVVFLFVTTTTLALHARSRWLTMRPDPTG